MSGAPSLTALVPDVYILNSPFFQSRRGLIVDADGSALVDTSVSLAETQMMIDKAVEMGHPVRRVVLTDGHFDHSAGCELLPDAERIAQRGAGEWMLSKHAQDYLATEPPEHPDLKRFTITLPTLEIEGSATLFLEKRELHLFPTPGHSPTHMSVLLEPDGIVFTGDAVMTCFPPVIQDGDSGQAVDAHRRILGTGFGWLVPGHGPVLDARAGRRYVEISLGYLQTLRARISQFDDPDLPFEEVARAVEDLPSVFPPAIEMVDEWHRKAVAKVWEERLRDLGGGRARGSRELQSHS